MEGFRERNDLTNVLLRKLIWSLYARWMGGEAVGRELEEWHDEGLHRAVVWSWMRSTDGKVGPNREVADFTADWREGLGEM